MKPVFVIMVTYRRFEQFKRTMESLLFTLPPGSLIRVVYNREGTHESDAQYAQYFPVLPANVRVLDTGTNNGWGSSVNEGLHLYSEWRDFDYVLESNNDVEYDLGWSQRAQMLMVANPRVGLLGLWGHINHGVRQRLPGLLVKDDMPAVAWLFRSADLASFLPIPEHGPTRNRGGNSEDSDFVSKIWAAGRLVACPEKDLAHHMDGYDEGRLGKPNESYL